MPPVKRPPSAFVAFASIRARKVKETSPTRVPYADTLREASAAWKKLSDAEKEVSVIFCNTMVLEVLIKMCFPFYP